MGTRHLVCIKLNEEYKVSQYGGMSGHPQIAGVGCLNHLNDILPHLDIFKEKLKFVELVEYDEDNPYNDEIQVTIPTHTVISVVYKTEQPLKFYPNIAYAGEFSCDWVYVIDLDEHLFKVYKGKNKDAEKEEKAFAQYVPEKNAGYRAVALLQAYPFNNLPDIDDFKQYYDDLEQAEEE